MSGATLIFNLHLAIARDDSSADTLFQDPEVGAHRRHRRLEIALQPAQHVGGVFVRPAHRFLGLRLGALDELSRLRFGTPQQFVVLEQPRALLLRRSDDVLGFIASALDEPIAFLVDATRLPDLFGDGGAHLIDEIQGGSLLQDDLAGHRDLATVDHESFEPLEQKLDVHSNAQCTAMYADRSTKVAHYVLSDVALALHGP